MSNFNEYIVHEANKEYKCIGRFYLQPTLALTLRASWSRSNPFQKNLWEAQFKSQALLDKNAVYACMAYVDLNPIRAKMNITSETSNRFP
jgi:hypothetical protein